MKILRTPDLARRLCATANDYPSVIVVIAFNLGDETNWARTFPLLTAQTHLMDGAVTLVFPNADQARKAFTTLCRDVAVGGSPQVHGSITLTVPTPTTFTSPSGTQRPLTTECFVLSEDETYPAYEGGKLVHHPRPIRD